MARTPQLIVLGSGTNVPRAERTTSCYLVDDGAGHALLVDLGPGALQRAAAAGHPLETLGGVLVTHAHPDHSADVVHLLFALRSPLVRAHAPPLPLVAPAELGLLMQRARNAWPGWLAAPGEKHALQAARPGSEHALGDTRARAFAVEHLEHSLGWRLRLPSGFEIAFSGDATEGRELEDLGRDADLFVLEAAMPDAAPHGKHLTPRRAARVAAAAGARALLLTHFYPPTEQQDIPAAVRAHYAGPWGMARDGLRLALRAPLRAGFADG